MKKQHIFGSIVAFSILCLVVSNFLLRAEPPLDANPDFSGAIWIAQADAIKKIATADGSELLHIPKIKNVRAIAVDDQRGTLWSYQQNVLWAYRFDGEPLLSIPLSPCGDNGNGPDVALSVNPTNGTAWLGVKKALHHFGPDGKWLGVHTLPDSVRALAWDPISGCLWVGTQKQVFALHNAGTTCKVLAPMDHPDVRDLAVDPESGDLWVAMKKVVQRYDADGHLQFEAPISKVTSVASDYQGGAWVAADKSLMRLDRTGRMLVENSSFGGPEKIVTFVADPSDSSIWVASKKTLSHFRSDGHPLQQLEVKGNIRDLALYVDRTPPGLTFTAPQEGSLLNTDTPILELRYIDGGSGVDLQTMRVLANDAEIAMLCNYGDDGASCTPTTGLLEGEVVLTATIRDHAGNPAEAPDVRVTVDTIAPTIALAAPRDGTVTNQAGLVLIGALSELASLAMNGSGVPIGPGLGFTHGPVTLQEGVNRFEFIALDAAGNRSDLAVHVTLDRVSPVAVDNALVEVGEVSDGHVGVAGQHGSVEPATSVAITNTRTGQTITVQSQSDGSFTATIAAQAGDVLTVTVADAAGNISPTSQMPVGSGLPQDPSTVAPALDRTVFTDFATATAFLYGGASPIQTGVAPETIEPRRVAVLRGRVRTHSAAPLGGVTISILGHAEFGQTLSRGDGLFDLAVNGGGLLTVRYEKEHYLPVQRQVQVPWRDYVWLPEVVMLPYDERVATIDLSATRTIQVARGSVMTDERGSRQATMVFSPGTQASMVLPNGVTQPLTSLRVRATEYTVGPNGPAAMPGALPPSSAYTYAVELSVDEAVAAGATTVQFSQPVSLYVENFLGFPVGGAVPAGYYDRSKGQWVASNNGKIIQVIGIVEGFAELDTDGDGAPDDAATHTALGISDGERQQLATLYGPGQSLWRVLISHFTPWDCNWPYMLPDDAQPPQLPEPQDIKQVDDPDCQGGSVIECQNQTLGETLDIAGTALSLHYRSNRVPGRRDAYTVKVPLSTASVSPSLKRIELVIQIAGRLQAQSFSAAPHQHATFTWDGLDAYGRPLQGPHLATIQIGHVYDGIYGEPAAGAQSFGAMSESRMTFSNVLQELTVWQEQRFQLGTWDARAQGFGGWTLGIQHSYAVGGRILYGGDGGQRRATARDRVITTVAGMGEEGNGGDGGLATQAQLTEPVGVIVGSDGSLYIVDGLNYRIRRVTPDGIMDTFAGTGTAGYSGDGGPARLADLGYPTDIALGPDGSLYISDSDNHCVRKVSPEGIITTVAGNGSADYSGDGGPATQAQLNWPDSIAVAPDGSLYIADMSNSRVRRVAVDGTITTVAGDGEFESTGDGGLAIHAQVLAPRDVAIGPDGSLYIAESGNVRRVAPDGVITTVAGANQGSRHAEGVPATQVRFRAIEGVDVGSDGSLYIADAWNCLVRRVGPDGIITTAAGMEGFGYNGDGRPAKQALLDGPNGVTVGPDGSLYIADSDSHRIRRVAPALPGFSQNLLTLPSEDGREVYVFDHAGRHLRTLNSLTGTVEALFTYDNAGQLVQITDGDGLTTTIERDTNGTPTAIIAAFGQQTTLTLDANGYLTSLTNPAGETTQLVYGPDGLLTCMINPVGHQYQFTYDTQGRLIRDQDPAGGFKALSRQEDTDSFTVTLSSAAGRTHTYEVDHLPDGVVRRVTTDPRGLQRATEIRPNGSQQVTAPDGSSLTLISGPDPRFGMQVPIATSRTLTTPGGLMSTVTESRTATLDDPMNLFSLSEMTETVTVNGRPYATTFDAASGRITSRTPSGRERVSLLDARGRLVEEQLPGLSPLRFTYDAVGRLVTIQQGARVASLSYDTLGRMASLSDALSRTTVFEYDAGERLRRQILTDGREIYYSYDANGNLTSIIPPGRSPHAFAYTAVDLAEFYLPPEIGAGPRFTQYVYNLDRQPVQVLRPDGTTVDLAYDSAGRVSAIDTPDGQTTFGYHQDSGHLLTITAPNGGTLTYAYDGSLLTQETWSGLISGSVQRTYDHDFRLTTQHVNGELAATFQYDVDGLLTAAGALTLERNAMNGLPMGTTIGNVSDARTYDSFGEGIEYRASHGGNDVLSVHYRRDVLGRIIEKTEIVDGQTNTYGYTYSPAGWLVEVRRNGASLATYTYDSNGNRQSHTNADGTFTADYDAQDRLIRHGTASYTYTLNGDFQRKTAGNATTVYEYDASGNLRVVVLPNGDRIEYLVDGRNRRIGKKVNGVIVQGFLYDGLLSPVVEMNGAGQVTTRFVYATRGNVPDYMIKGGITYRILSDHLGSPRVVIDTTTGHIVQRLFYDAFGKVIFDDNPGFQPFGFAGGLYDSDTRLTRFGARDYDAETGRWTAKDPILFAGGDTNLL